jgi:hypothetical protein
VWDVAALERSPAPLVRACLGLVDVYEAALLGAADSVDAGAGVGVVVNGGRWWRFLIEGRVACHLLCSNACVANTQSITNNKQQASCCTRCR